MPKCSFCRRPFDTERGRSQHESVWCPKNPQAGRRKAVVERRQLESSRGSTVEWRGEMFPSETERACAEYLLSSGETYEHWPEPLQYQTESGRTTCYYPDFRVSPGHYVEPGEIDDDKLEKIRRVEEQNNVRIETYDSQQVFALLSRLKE